jgi:hypothetical protein
MTLKSNFVVGKYPIEFIKLVLSEIDSGKYTGHSARAAHKIAGKMTVYRWLKNRDRYFPSESPLIEESMEKKTLEELLKENKQLQKDAEYSRHKAEAYGKAIEIAEKLFNIVILKKSDAKQPKK